MPTDIIITLKEIIIRAELFDTPCANAIANILPIEVRPNEWGDEFYFTIPVEMSLDETARKEVKAGDIGYWPPGNALAIFFGPTPLSSGIDPVPASEVNLVGRITDDTALLRKAKSAVKIKIEKNIDC